MLKLYLSFSDLSHRKLDTQVEYVCGHLRDSTPWVVPGWLESQDLQGGPAVGSPPPLSTWSSQACAKGALASILSFLFLFSLLLDFLNWPLIIFLEEEQ